MSDNGESGTSPWWLPIREFGAHCVVGTCIFVIISVPALVLDLAVHWLGDSGLGRGILVGLGLGAYLLFAVDFILFLCFLSSTAWKTTRKMWKL